MQRKATQFDKLTQIGEVFLTTTKERKQKEQTPGVYTLYIIIKYKIYSNEMTLYCLFASEIHYLLLCTYNVFKLTLLCDR